MSEISEKAVVSVVLADFANVDAAGKVNLIGANWTATAVQQTGLTAPQAVVVLIQVPATLAGESFALSVALLDDTNTPVQFPGQQGAMRVQQLMTAQRSSAPGVHLPPDVPCKIQTVLNLGNGMPLEPGRSYRWQVEIDTHDDPDWAASFFVLGPPPQPVIG